MEKLIFVSDPHICAPGEHIIGLDLSVRLQTVLDGAITVHPDAAALVMLGDLTHHGDAEEYRALQQVLASVSLPIIPMIGNHDRREAFLAQFPGATQTASGHIQHWRDIGNHRLITLDTLDGPPYPDGHHSGYLCRERVAFLDSALTTRGDRHAVVCMHHPPFETGIIGMDQIMLKNGSEILDLLARHGNLHLICGHMHQTISGHSRGVSWTIFKSSWHQGVVDLVNATSSLSTDECSTYGLALLHRDGTIVHSVDAGTGAHVTDGYEAFAVPAN